MTAEQFCNWLSGYLDIAAPREIREREILVIKDHLEEVKNPLIGVPPYYSGNIKFGIKADKVRPANC